MFANTRGPKGVRFLMVLAIGVAQCTCAANKASNGNQTNMNPQNPTGLSFDKGVTIRLTPVFTEAKRASFGVPVARGTLKSVNDVLIKIDGKKIAAEMTELLPDLDKDGARVGVRAFRVQLDASAIGSEGSDVEVYWSGGSAPALPPVVVEFKSEEVSSDSASIVSTVERTIKSNNGTYELVESNRSDKTVFVGREPRLLPTYPVGYLAQTGILGPLLTSTEVEQRADLAGVRFLSKAIQEFLRSAMYEEPYAINPDPDSLPNFDAQYEAWLYDRCATFLLAYAHAGDVKFLRHALKTCSYYSSRIELSGANRGIFTGKPDPDAKYSHIRGLYTYYALTGDERAADSIQAIGELWLNDQLFVGPYRQGHVRGVDKLWTERLLGTSLEGLLYGHRLKGDLTYLTAFKEMLATAHKHISGDQVAIDEVNPGVGLPPQNCFIHTDLQHGEGSGSTPWCSSWMSELLLDTVLQWHEVSQDARVLEIIVRLTRFLRDSGSNYFRGNPAKDSFLAPTICYKTGDDDPRMLVPLYGAGINKDGQRVASGEYEDYEHCTDATALVAAGRWAFEKGAQQKNAPAPFSDEKASFQALHEEFLFCADRTFVSETRARRNPLVWKSSELAAGASDPAKFIKDQKIGYPQHQLAPLRKIGWWFNMSILQFGLLSQAKISLTEAKPGRIQPASCP